MLIVSDRPLLIADVLNPRGIPFECEESYAESLLERGVAHHAMAPKVSYETTPREQDAGALREQGVTCLCLTRNRREWLPKAIESFQAQNYPIRELLIVADGEDVRDLVPDRPDIRLIHFDEGRPIGEKRNWGIEQARGRYIAHWDDDDYSKPRRLVDQVERLRSSGLAVTGYSEIDFTDGAQWWRYSGDEGFAPGSSLLYEKSWWEKHPFLCIQIGEDGAFVKTARDLGQIITSKSNGLLTATIHDKNTSPRVMDRFWTPLEKTVNSLSVVIPSKNLANLIPCMKAVRECEPEATLIVIDDGLANRDFLISGKFAPVIVVNGEKPFIFSRNVNKGIQQTAGDVVVLNDDALLKTPGGLTALQDAAAEREDLGIVAATTNNVGNRNQHPRGIGLREDPRMVCFICVLIPRRTLNRVGLLDERFTGYGHEDDDYSYRVRREGLKVGIHDGCFVDHASLKSSFRGDPRVSANLDRGREIFTQKWGSYPL